MKLKTLEDFERDLNKFVDARHKNMEAYTAGLDQAKEEKRVAEEAAEKALLENDREAYRRAVSAGIDADFNIKMHTKQLEQLNKPAADMPSADEVLKFLINVLADMDRDNIFQFIEEAEKIRISGQAAADKRKKVHDLFRLYCENVTQTPELAATTVFMSKSAATASKMIQALPEYRTAKGYNPIDPIIK